MSSYNDTFNSILLANCIFMIKILQGLPHPKKVDDLIGILFKRVHFSPEILGFSPEILGKFTKKSEITLFFPGNSRILHAFHVISIK